MIDRLLVVDVPEATQVERTCIRDGNAKNLVKKIIQQQVNRQKRLSLADDIIDNSGRLNELEQQVDALHKQYLITQAN